MKTKTQTGTNFGWKPLIEIPVSIPSISYLQGDDAKAFLEEFNATAQEQYGDAAGKVTVLTYDSQSKLLRGSNPFAVVHADNLLKSKGVRVATMADLEKALNANALNLRGTYEDTALVLRNRSDPNSYLAGNLADQLTQGHKAGKIPIVIQLRGLQLQRDSGSDYGLSFKLTDESQFFQAPQLDEKNHGRNFSKLDDKGLPILEGTGHRNVYTRKSGLSRLYLGWSLNLGSDGEDLADSYEVGRVALVRSGEAAGADVVRAQYEKAQSELSAKMDVAKGILDRAKNEAFEALK